MPDALSVGESKRSESGRKSGQGTTVSLQACSWEQEQQEAALDIKVRAWNWLVQLIKCSVLSYTAARLTPGMRRVPSTPSAKPILLNIPRSKCLPHWLFQVPLFAAWSLGVGVHSEKQQGAKRPGNKGAAGHPLCSHYTARCSLTSLSPCSPGEALPHCTAQTQTCIFLCLPA